MESHIDYTKFSPVCCVIGHVDVGKTKLLDYLRNSDTKEVSGITQQLGATFYNKRAIENITGTLSNKISIPGIIIIDTPGHECFTTMRILGSKLSHLAILVIDVVKGVEKSAEESIHILKGFGTDFIIALNKIDKIYGWKKVPNASLKKSFASQTKDVLDTLNGNVKKIICKLAELEVNAMLYYDINMNTKVFRSMVPISAQTGEGVPDLLLLISKLIDRKKKVLEKSDLYKYAHGYILDKREDNKFGQFFMAINVLGTVKEGNEVIILHGDSRVQTKIKSVIVVNDNVEMKDKHSFKRKNIVDGSHGIGIIFEDDCTIFPGDLYIESSCTLSAEDLKPKKLIDDCIDETPMDVDVDFDKYLSKTGVSIVAPSTSILSAMFKSMSQDGLAVRTYSMGTMDKNTIIRTASVNADKKDKVKSDCLDIYSSILVFDPIYSHGDEDKLTDYIEKDILDFAEEQKVHIFISNTIYRLKEKYLRFRNAKILKLRKRYGKNIPFTLNILPQYVFLKTTPLLFGVRVESGCLHKGAKVRAVHNSIIVELGTVANIQKNKEEIIFATKGEEVCIKITDDVKNHYGKDFDHTYLLTDSLTPHDTEISNFIRDVLNI
jgi:translation initiation factor 5B